MRAYKWTIGNKPTHGSETHDQSGVWMEVVGPLVWCENGFHAARPACLPLGMGTELWEVELDGEILERNGGEVIGRRIRFVRKLDWNRLKVAGFALGCAKRCAEYAAANILLVAGDTAAIILVATYAATTAGTAAVKALNDGNDCRQYGDEEGMGSSYRACESKAVHAATMAATSTAVAAEAESPGTGAANERRLQLEWIETTIGEKLLDK